MTAVAVLTKCIILWYNKFIMGKTYFLLIISVLILSFVNSAYAQGPITPVSGTPITLIDLQIMITQVVTFIITVSGIIAAGVIVFAGIKWMMAGANEQKVAQAKGMLKSGLIGALIIFGVGTIFATIVWLVEARRLY